MIGIRVDNNVREFVASVDRLKSQDINRAIAQALNRTAQGAQAEAVRKIREDYNVKAAEVRRAFKIRRAYHGKLVAVVEASGKNLNVIGFGARQTKKGVSFAVKQGKRKTIPGSFIVTLGNNGYTGVFMRAKDGSKLVGRYPIKAVTTVSVPGMFRHDAVTQALRSLVPGRFDKELRAAVRLALLKA